MSRLKKVKIKASIIATENNCSNCGKKYHMDAQCWIKHPDKRPNRKGHSKQNSKKSGDKRKEEFTISAVAENKFKFDKPEVAMITDEEICSVSGIADRMYIDSCAQNRIWLIKFTNPKVKF